MRLLVVSQYFWPEDFRVHELVEELVKRGHSVTVLTGRPNYPSGRIPDAFAANPQAYASYAGANVIRVPLRPRGTGNLRLVLNYWSFVFWGCVLGPWLLRRMRFDAIFCFQTSPITSALPAILLRWFKRAPLVLWVLDLWPDTLSAVGVVRSPRALAWVGQLVAFIYRRCDLILTQSQSFREPVRRWSGDDVRIRYFPQWADGVFGSGVDGIAVAEELQPYEGCFKVLFAGNIGDAQDFPAILGAAARLKHLSHIRWIVVGDGRALPQVRADVERLGLQEHVQLLGRHPLERMPGFFAGADVLLVSLKKEPIFALTVPGKVQSYLAAGRPVVAMLDGEGARVVRESGAGVSCEAGNSEALAARIEKVANLSSEERRLLGQAGLKYAGEVFGRDKLLRQLEQWLAELPTPNQRLP